jgi:MOSC domain-containing protein YiiM
MMPTTLVSLQVGAVRQMHDDGTSEKPWTTGFHKQPVTGPVHLGTTNLAGDAQADLVHHGGPDKAVCVYSVDHFPFWRAELGREDVGPNGFGENFSVAALTEEAVCIGDVWAVGSARVQVSQPRRPCWKLARRWHVTDLPARVIRTGRTGWYFRVLTEGTVCAGDALTLEERPCPMWTVAHANAVYHDRHAPAAAELAELPWLSDTWREALRSR